MTTESIQIAMMCGSLRAKSINEAIMRALPGLAPEGVTLTALPSVDRLPHYNSDLHEVDFPDAVVEMGDQIRRAAGVLIVTPEYNYSIPGPLKNALDWISRLPNQPFIEKPVAIYSSSVSPLGGVRTHYHLRQVFVYLDAFLFNKPEIIITHAHEKVAIEEGRITDAPTNALIETQLRAFQAYIARTAPLAV